jgi:8-oxo-dGTP pyrophosphatase MutT (NUDIX family)
MGREFKISDKKRKAVIDNLVNMVEVVLKEQVDVDNYLITEQKIADKYKVDIEEIIFLEKKAIPFEMDIKNAKIRRAVILKNLYDKGLDFYKENDGKLKSDFTDAVILNENGEILFLLRNKKDSIEGNKYGFPGGHLERSLNVVRNVKKEIKEETGLDVLECNLAHVKNINGNKNKIYYFICTLPREYQIVLNEREHSNYKWMSLKEIINTPKEQFMFDLKDILLKEIFKVSNVK